MLKRGIEWLQKRQKEITERMDALNAFTTGEEARSLTEDEDKEFDKLDAEFKANQKELERKQTQKRRSAAYIENVKKEGEEGARKQLKQRHSMSAAMRSIVFPTHSKLEGAELEAHQEAENEAREFGYSIEGVGVPSFFMRKELLEERGLTVGVPADGGYTVPTELGQMIPYLQPRLQVEALGATVLTGLTGNLDLPKNSGIATAAWAGETDEVQGTKPTFSKQSLSPKRLGAFTDFSKQLLLQSNLSVDALVSRQLERAIRIKLDSTALIGSGTGNVPEGLLNMSGIGVVEMDVNGAVPTREKLIDLISKIAIENADIGRLAFLTTPGIRGQLQKTKTDSGSGLFVWNQKESLLDYRALVSTQVPSDLTKGTSNNCHSIIYGNWEELILAQWGGLDLVIDPYSKAKSGEVTIVANSFWDIAVKNMESFAAIKDALVS